MALSLLLLRVEWGEIIREITRPGKLPAPHGVKKVPVVLGGADLVEQKFRRFEVVHRVEELPQHPHFLQDLLLDQELFAAGAGAVDVDRRKDALLVHPAVEVTTSPFTVRVISVTSSGRSSIRSTISVLSGLFAVIACASCCMSTVFPALGGETIRPRWPLPIGAMMSMMRLVMFSSPFMSRSSFRCLSGCSGVRFSNRILCLEDSGASALTLSTLTSAK